jgi:hypothetical protein
VPIVDSSFGKKSIGTDKTKDDEKGLYFNLNSFEKNVGNRQPAVDSSSRLSKHFHEESNSL